jgi:hypothetical protein
VQRCPHERSSSAQKGRVTASSAGYTEVCLEAAGAGAASTDMLTGVGAGEGG